MTTIRHRSFAGPGLAQFASTLIVCAGLVVLLPEPVSSDHDLLSDADTSFCAASQDSSRDHQWTDDVRVDDPDSCDDDDDGDDDGDDDTPGGSGQAISAGQHGPANLADALHVVHMDADLPTSRPLDAHSLRGPPAGNQEPCDVDVDDDDDDDDDSPGAYHSASIPAAQSREPHLLASVHPFRPASVDSGHALRAPPQ